MVEELWESSGLSALVLDAGMTMQELQMTVVGEVHDATADKVEMLPPGMSLDDTPHVVCLPAKVDHTHDVLPDNHSPLGILSFSGMRDGPVDSDLWMSVYHPGQMAALDTDDVGFSDPDAGGTLVRIDTVCSTRT